MSLLSLTCDSWQLCFYSGSAIIVFPVPLWFITKLNILKCYNPHAWLVLVFIIDVWPVIGGKQSWMGKREFNYDTASLKKTQLAQTQLLSVSAHITRQNKKFIIGFELIKYPNILGTIIYMLAYILYFTWESKMIIVGLHIITSRHVFNIHISTSKVCIFLGASQQTRYVEQWINTRRFRVSEV